MKEIIIGAIIAIVIIGIFIGFGFYLSYTKVENVPLPNLVGLTIEEVKEKIEQKDLNIEIEGKGNIVVSQEPPYMDGYLIKSNSTIKLKTNN